MSTIAQLLQKLFKCLIALVVVVPMFWWIAYPLWIGFTPPWFDLIAVLALALAVLIACIFGAVERQRPCVAEKVEL